MAWDADTRHDVADLFALLSVPDLRCDGWCVQRDERERYATDAEYRADKLASNSLSKARAYQRDPEAVRAAWREAKARAVAANPEAVRAAKVAANRARIDRLMAENPEKLRAARRTAKAKARAKAKGAL